MKEEKKKSNIDNISAFVNYGNQNLPVKAKMVFGVLLASAFCFFASFLLDDWRISSICVAVILAAAYIWAEVYVHQKLKKTKNFKWGLLPINLAYTFLGSCFLHVSEIVFFTLSVPIIIHLGAVLIFALLLVITNNVMIYGVKSGKYAMKQKERKVIDLTSLNIQLIFLYTSVVAIIVIAPLLGKILGIEWLDISLPIMVLVVGCFFVSMPNGFLKFYYATKYDIEVIPTWLDKYETIPIEKFQYQAESGKGFYVVITQKRKPSISYIIELFPHDRKGDGTELRFDTESYDKKSFHIDTILNENGLVCYVLNGAPFGELSDGRFVDFRRVQLEGESNPEIVIIGETLIQQDIQWFDDFGEYLVKSNSQIGIEITKRYQDKNFTEAEIQQIEEHSLDIAKIAEWAREILLSKEKGVDDL